MRQQPFVGVDADTRPPRGDAQRLDGIQTRQRGLAPRRGADQPLELRGIHDRLGPVALGAGMRLGASVGPAAWRHLGPRVDPDGRDGAQLPDGGTGATDDEQVVGAVAHLHAQAEPHTREPGCQRLGVGRIDEEPRRLAVVDDRGRMLDAPLRIEDEQFCGHTRREMGQRLRRQRVQPAAAVFSGDGDDTTIAEGREGGPGR
ncbi:hypothetical protein QE392_001873 [Microbacterium proteolyticum]|nr:hypothetical protein [Microbacterium proteolyticum]